MDERTGLSAHWCCGMDRFRRHAAPQALLVLATFLLSMTPRRAAANNDPPPPETASGSASQAAAVATAQAEMQSAPATTAEPEELKSPTAPGAAEVNPGSNIPAPGIGGGGNLMSLPTGENKTGLDFHAIETANAGPGHGAFSPAGDSASRAEC